MNRRRRGDLHLTMCAILGCLAMLSQGFFQKDVVRAEPLTGTPEKRQPPGDPQAGRGVFNGKGVCSYCHGLDGDLAKRPQLAPNTADLIARLDPPPADLRRRESLKLQDDRQRAAIIREGHPGTGMFPDTTMTDRELADTLAFLAQLRREGRSPTH